MPDSRIPGCRVGSDVLPQRRRDRRAERARRRIDDLCRERRPGIVPARRDERCAGGGNSRFFAGLPTRIALHRPVATGMDGNQRRSILLRFAQRRNPSADGRRSGPVFALGQPCFHGLRRCDGRTVGRHQCRRRQLCRRLPAEFREILQGRRAIARGLSRARVRRRRSRTYLDRHRKGGTAALRCGRPDADAGRRRPAAVLAVHRVLRCRASVARDDQGALPARSRYEKRQNLRYHRIARFDDGPPGFHRIPHLGGRSARRNDRRAVPLRPSPGCVRLGRGIRRSVRDRHRRGCVRHTVGFDLRPGIGALRCRETGGRTHHEPFGRSDGGNRSVQQTFFGDRRVGREYLDDELRRRIQYLRPRKPVLPELRQSPLRLSAHRHLFPDTRG